MCETRKCSSCFEEKSISDFYVKNTKTGMLHKRCKRCCIDKIKVPPKDKTHKICKICGERKPFSEYQKAGNWLQPYCKPCDSYRKMKYHYENADRVNAKRKALHDRTKVLMNEDQKAAYIIKRREWLKKARAVAHANKMSPEEKRIKKSISNKSYRDKHPDKKILSRQKYKESGRQREVARLYNRVKNQTDPQFKLRKNLRTRVRFALKSQNAYKSSFTEDLLGCTIPEYKKHIESLFTEGMTWELLMKGEIWIDHIKPCVAFDLTNPEQQKACFNYKNTQPLWKIDNLKKGAKLI